MRFLIKMVRVGMAAEGVIYGNPMPQQSGVHHLLQQSY